MAKKKKRKTSNSKKVSESPLRKAMKQKIESSKKAVAGPSTNSAPIKMAVWGASPYVITGFGEVMKQILRNLFKDNPGQYEVFQIGINFVNQSYDESFITGGPSNGSYKQWPAFLPAANGAVDKRTIYGQRKFLDLLTELLPKVDLDVIFIFEDPFILGGPVPGTKDPIAMIDAFKLILKQTKKEHIPIVSYYPIDGQPKPVWLHNLSKTDYPITYLQFGKKYSEDICPALRGRVSVIPHGVDLTEFYPLPKEQTRTFKRAMFGERFADKFMFLNVNRNQLRKMIPSSLIAFREFKKQVPESFLYLNMKAADVGWHLPEVCASLGLRVGEDVLFPPDFNVQKGLSLENLNKVFNSADALISTALGGGWELAITQAFSTKTTVIAPANTSHIELCGPQTGEEARGVLYNSGGNLSQYAFFPNDNEVLRPLPDLDDMLQKMLWVYNNPERCRQVEDRAYKWVDSSLNWSKNIVPNFNQVFQSAALKKRVACGQAVKPTELEKECQQDANIFVGTV